MQELLQEYSDARQTRLLVDRQHCVIRGVKILGLRSKNGRVYLPAALASATALYEGAKVNINHPKGHPSSPRDYQDRIGTLRGVAVREAEGLFGDLHLNPAHALTNQLLWDAEHAPENVGLSHNVQAQTARRGDNVVVETILKVQAVDLVADPATTRGLFESATADPGAGQSTNPPAGHAEASLGIAGAGHGPSPAPRAPVIPLSTLEGTDAPLIQLRAERDALAAEVARLQARIQRHERREMVRRALAEQGLPYPDGEDTTSRTLVSAAFVEALMAADSEPAVRELIRERAELVQAARGLAGDASGGLRAAGRPRSREQGDRSGAAIVRNAQDFVRAIT